MTTTSNNGILLKNLDVIINDKHILSKMDFFAKDGESTLIYGQSESGKTTLLNVVNFLYYPKGGQYFYFGK